MADHNKQSYLRRILSRSLAVRVIAFSSFWAIIALVVIATIISALFRQVSERGFDSVLSAYLNNVIGSVGVAEDGGLQGNPNLDDLRFLQPQSGWYWAVEPVTDDLGRALRSPSMATPIPSPDASRVPFNAGFQRNYKATGPGGDTIQVVEAELVVGDQGQVARFRVMGNRSELEDEISRFIRTLYGYLALFGIGMVAINVFAILYGLRPLNRVQQALSDIRAGTAQRLAGPFPTEIEALADETNALIDNNRRIVERSRKQVGNLAHSLKTPLAVLMNEGDAVGGERGKLITAQAKALQQQLDHYLQRARAAAQRDSLVFRTPVQASLERMARVMSKLNPSIDLQVELPDEVLVFAGEREDLEEINGNLMENAMKWAAGQVALTLEDGGEPGEGRGLRIVIEDDGPGIPEEQARDAVKRGRRLDETKPGTGLGLAIVADLVEEYGGTLALERSVLGGLKAVVTLPRAEA
ncbi:sensor histidine kinase [Nitratireductor aquimarinus]|uniref:ATP-binding protein n=1 Tax=Alphaproteobacteria TaxID=28211 RepID=UPI0019D36737|nr:MULTISPECIES: sensor histidine kinase [Alphaproteobacteria]MBN7755952.1 sensor histidine kinase [Nitratireductor aquimarinus]